MKRTKESWGRRFGIGGGRGRRETKGTNRMLGGRKMNR